MLGYVRAVRDLAADGGRGWTEDRNVDIIVKYAAVRRELVKKARSHVVDPNLELDAGVLDSMQKLNADLGYLKYTEFLAGRQAVHLRLSRPGGEGARPAVTARLPVPRRAHREPSAPAGLAGGAAGRRGGPADGGGSPGRGGRCDPGGRPPPGGRGTRGHHRRGVPARDLLRPLPGGGERLHRDGGGDELPRRRRAHAPLPGLGGDRPPRRATAVSPPTTSASSRASPAGRRR